MLIRPNNDKSNSPMITKVTWNCDDSFAIATQNGHIINVWNSANAKLIHQLRVIFNTFINPKQVNMMIFKGQSNQISLLNTHPTDPRLLLSASKDGELVQWNLLTGDLIQKFENKVIFIKNNGIGF